MSQAIDDAPTRDAAALIRAIAETRDKAAFAALFGQYAPRLKAYMRRLGAADEIAEEIVQETMLMVWRKAALFDPTRAAASTWIYTILRNLRIDMMRRIRPLPPELAAADAQAVPADADDVIDAAERTARLRAALASLPPEQAEVVRLSFFDERPHAEIERALGIPLGTVKSRLRLAMARLRRVLEGSE
jgi:RNA polymerase sigma-70 factor (ECF subfamily)